MSRFFGTSAGYQVLLCLSCGLLLLSCNDKFMAESTRSKVPPLAAISSVVDDAGNVSGVIDPNSSSTQLVGFNSGDLAGSAVVIPPGALSFPVAITVGAGETLSSDLFLQDLGITDNAISAAGPSVAFTSSQPVEAINPLTLSLPFTAASALSLTESNETIVVLYRWTKVVDGEQSHSMGIIPNREIIISKDKVSFQTTKFGVFQLGRAEKPIEERVNVPSPQPPIQKKLASNPLIGSWSVCTNTMGAGSSSMSLAAGANPQTQVQDAEMSFPEPKFARVRAWPGGALAVVRGNSPLTMESYVNQACANSSESSLSIKGYLHSLEGPSPKFLKIKDNLGNPSRCQQVYPIAPTIHVKKLSRWTNGTNVQNIEVEVINNRPSLTAKIYKIAACTGEPVASQAIESSSLQSVISVNNSSVSEALFVQIVAANDSQSACLKLPRISTSTTPSTLGASIAASLESSPSGYLKISGWNTGYSPTIKFFTDTNCQTQEASKQPYTVPSGQTEAMINLTESTNSIKVWQSNYSGCIEVKALPTPKPYFNRYEVGPSWIHFDFVSVEPLTIEKHPGLGCGSANPESIPAAANLTSYGWYKFEGLNPNNQYSFKLKTDSNLVSACQNVMTTEANQIDYSYGNNMAVPNNQGINLDIPSSVTDGNAYNLKLSFNGLPPAETDSITIPSVASSNVPINIDASRASGSIITAITPPGCRFIWTPVLRNQSVKILCDGRTDNPSNTQNEWFSNNLPLTKFGDVAISGDQTTEEKPVNIDQSNGGKKNEDPKNNIDTNISGRGIFGAHPALQNASVRITLRLTNNKFTMTEDLFSALNCSPKSRISSKVENGDYKLAEEDAVSDTIPLDAIAKDKNGTLFDARSVFVANKYPEQYGCQKDGWIIGKSQSLMNTNCSDSLNQTKYERLKISKDRLYFCGKTVGDGSQESDTPDSTGTGSELPKPRINSCEITPNAFSFERFP